MVRTAFAPPWLVFSRCDYKGAAPDKQVLYLSLWAGHCRDPICAMGQYLYTITEGENKELATGYVPGLAWEQKA
jgi:hypothetical protein